MVKVGYGKRIGTGIMADLYGRAMDEGGVVSCT
jgi:hypothetical protein